MTETNCQINADGMGMDQALLRIQYAGEQGDPDSAIFSLWTQSEECHRCSFVEKCFWNVTDDRPVQFFVDTRYATNLAVRKIGSSANICELKEHFGEHGTYNLTIRDSSCHLEQVSESVNSSLPILYVFVVYVVLAILYFGAVAVRRYWRKIRTVESESSALNDPNGDGQRISSPEAKLSSPEPKKKRLRSLDAFRGISIVIMIFVNLGGGGYYFFAHSVWNGLTVADLVFPWFMFIMGTSMYLSISGAVRKQIPIQSIWWNIVRRSIILFLLGVFLNGGSDNNLRTFRIFGVLQRFGITYLVVGALLCIRFLRARRGHGSEIVTDLSVFGDLKTIWLEWILVLALMAVHTCITFLMPVPGCPRGYLGPGGLSDNGMYENCTGGATGYVDQSVITSSHMYQWPTCREIYQTKVPYDPEGLMGLFTATMTVFLGVQAGVILVTFSSHRSRLVRWVCWGLVCGIVAGVLCLFSKNDGWIPVNKNLWSLSYVLTMASMAFVSLSFLYYVVDVARWWDGSPFYQAGMNSIVLYMGHECFGQYLPFSWKPMVEPATHAEQLAMNAWATTLFVILAIYLHYKRIFISI